jgi:hypothetical protein
MEDSFFLLTTGELLFSHVYQEMHENEDLDRICPSIVEP